MTDHPGSDDGTDFETNRRDLLKGLLLGGSPAVDSRAEALKALVVGNAAAGPGPVGSAASAPGSAGGTASASMQGSSSPIPVRATEKVSMREIADHTSGVSGPPYRMTEVATERGLLNLSHSKNPREDPPFAFRELITSQKIQNTSIKNKTGGNSTWQNWVYDHFRPGLTEFKPQTKRELIDAVIENARDEHRIRAVGSGHSHSKVAAPERNFIRLSWQNSNSRLDGLVDTLDRKWLSEYEFNTPTPNRFEEDDAIVRVEAGATIKYLNRKLLLDEGEGYGLKNMGSFDGQTLAGAVNTSTHGTGNRLGSLADTVRSVELVTVMESPAQPGRPLVRMFRIEPNDGWTVREDFESDVGDHEMTLIQNDDVFHSAVVGYGCMGVAYAYNIGVQDKYFLYEDSRTKHWNDFKNDIEKLRRVMPGGDLYRVANGRHFQFRVNLAQLDYRDNSKGNRNPECLLISHRIPGRYDDPVDFNRWPKEPDYWETSWPPERTQRSVQEAIRKIINSNSIGKGGTGLPPRIVSKVLAGGGQQPVQGDPEQRPLRVVGSSRFFGRERPGRLNDRVVHRAQTAA